MGDRLSKEDWLELCKNNDKYCSYEEVSDCTYKEAELYIQNMPVFIPM